MRRHQVPSPALPAHLVNLEPKPRHDDHRAQLTTLHVTERCDVCPWPAVCEGDKTCWELERGQGWSRSRADLRRNGR